MREVKVNRLECVFQLDSSDFEQLVQEVYDRYYVFSHDERLNAEDTRLYEDISGTPGRFEEMKLMEFNRIGHYNSISRGLLEDLCHNGHIEAGNYIITIENIKPIGVEDEITEAPRQLGDYDLIIFDFYDTIVHMEDEEWVPRNGIPELLEALRDDGNILVVCSDAGEDKIRERLGNLVDYFTHIYGHSNLVYEGEVFYKNLGRICEDFGITRMESVFIGDNHKGTDERSAKKYDIEYIRVPNAREDKVHDFSQLLEQLR